MTSRSRPRACASSALLILAIVALVPAAAHAQTGGLTREQMWFAPTAEDWKKPCLIKWQRTWEDAVALSKETGKAILVCINMDGEIASEHYAGIRYRQPEIAKLYEPYITVIASTYRHTPRDYDEKGNRIPCPRFGCVTCGEHIAIEPLLYEKFMEGKRIAPRHIMVELDGKETYDVYYAFDTDSVFKAIKDGIANRKIKPKPVVKGDRSLIEKVASLDSADRTEVEKAFVGGDADLRRSLLGAAAALGDKAPVELLRLALYGFDEDMSKKARAALAKASSNGAVDLITDALSGPMDPNEKKALVAALDRLGKKSEEARRLARVHKGLAAGSRTVNVKEWSQALSGGATYKPALDEQGVTERLEKQDGVFASKDPAAHVELAEAFLARALARRSDVRSMFTRALLTDARDTAADAEKLGAKGWRVNTVLALTAFHLGDFEEAHRRSAAAVKEMPAEPKGESTALVLALFAELRHKQIVKAVEGKTEWPGQWLTDMHAAHTLLLRHPHGTAVQAVSHYDFLRWLGARGQAKRFISEAIDRFPGAWHLHDRLRKRTLWRRGIKGVEAVYTELLAKPDASPLIRWYAGYASSVAAEYHRRRSNYDEARAAYGRAIAHYEASIKARADLESSADHYVAMAHGGLARISYEKDENERAVGEVLASFARKESAAATLDGLNLSTVDTAKMLLARLKEKKLAELAERLDGAMKKLDPELLKLPAYETPPGGGNPPRGRRRGR